MAAPTKQKLEYFSFDVDFFADEKIEAISGEFGIKGEIVAVKLLCAIYRNGYFIEWSEMLKMKLLKNLPGIKKELLEQIVNRLVKWKFFNEDLFNSDKILTSTGIQKRFEEATKRRKKVDNSHYWLLNGVNVNINHTSTEVNANKNSQSKVKESKVNETKERENDSRAIPFLKKNYASRFQTEFQMRYGNKIKNKVKFAEDFNDTVDQEELEYTAKKLFARLGKYARNWIENQDKYQKNEQKPATAPERF